ncbi:MAG: DEAD/DEAH box helicase, partial [Coriobacteriales bacterium]|nr:DEAD/DEAH box helicase [Coriobacteriales bacterium]
ALTGTPIENRLSELWSIFDFLMPGLLGSYRRFRERYEQPIVDGQEEAMRRLQELVGHFVMRRLKSDVLVDLPEKSENVVYAHMEGEQLKLYRAHEQRLRESIVGKSTAEFARERIAVLAELTRLREICCDPHLVFDDYDDSSAKLSTILDLVETAIDSGKKLLLFSQFTSYLDIISTHLSEQGVAHYTITGATPKRQRLELVNEFNEDDTPVFLVSLKAGGTGLNLTGASVVIHADPWWNSAAEDQATDRAHRIGQTKDVMVYKVIAKDSIEERILALQETKSDLADKLINSEGLSLSSLTRDELVSLLS